MITKDEAKDLMTVGLMNMLEGCSAMIPVGHADNAGSRVIDKIYESFKLSDKLEVFKDKSTEEVIIDMQPIAEIKKDIESAGGTIYEDFEIKGVNSEHEFSIDLTIYDIDLVLTGSWYYGNYTFRRR